MQPHVNRAWNYTSITSANVCNVWCGDGHAKKKLTGNWTRSFRSDMTFRSKPQQALLDVDYFFPKNFSRTESSFVCLHRNLKEFCTIESIKFLHIALILFFRPLRYNVAMHLNKSSKKAFDLETFWNFFVSGCGLQYLKLARQERKATYIVTRD